MIFIIFLLKTMFEYSFNTLACCSGLRKSGTTSPGLLLLPIMHHIVQPSWISFFFSQIDNCFYFLLHLEPPPIIFMCPCSFHTSRIDRISRHTFKSRLSRLWCRNKQHKESSFLVHVLLSNIGQQWVSALSYFSRTWIWSLYPDMCFHSHHRNRKEKWGNVYRPLM